MGVWVLFYRTTMRRHIYDWNIVACDVNTNKLNSNCTNIITRIIFINGSLWTAVAASFIYLVLTLESSETEPSAFGVLFCARCAKRNKEYVDIKHFIWTFPSAKKTVTDSWGFSELTYFRNQPIACMSGFSLLLYKYILLQQTVQWGVFESL